MDTPVIDLRGITRRYPGVVANDRVDLSVAGGEVHAIVGENGAGKSTLMKVLYGETQPDAGSISIAGTERRFRSPKDAIAVGIGMVHQHFMLADNLSVLENIVLGSEPTRGVVIDFKAARSGIDELSQAYGFNLDPDAKVETLSVGERQRVEIAKVLYRGARILILDEPTSVLVPHEVQDLFTSVRGLTDEGVTVLFISHKLDEVLAIADRITVMRGGRIVGTVVQGEVDARQLAEMMVGSELPTPETRESTVTDQVALRVRDLGVRSDDGRWVLEGIAFEIRRGEIVGVAGVEGNGQRALVDALLGVATADAGSIELAGRDITRATCRKRREAGIGLIPEDRQRQGLLLPSPLWENAALGHQTVPPFGRGAWIDRGGSRQRTTEIVSRFDVRTPGIDVPAAALSGGNQQKLVVGREIIATPDVLLAAQPTRGIDVGAQAAVWEELRRARAAGMGVLLVSADLEELIGLSDTLHVIFRGRFTARLDPATVTAEELGAHMTGATERQAS